MRFELTSALCLGISGVVAGCGGSADDDAELALLATAAASAPAEEQGWTPGLRAEMHTLSLGGEFVPYRRFFALEAAGGDRLVSAATLRQFGMLANPDSADGLPFGFGKTIAASGTAFVGYNCFACHTSEVRYQGRSRIVYGGAGRLNFFGYLDHVFEALTATYVNALRFDRFARKVLGADDNFATRAALYSDLGVRTATFNGTYRVASSLVTREEGFGRVDANGRTAAVLALYLNPAATPSNVDAPVAFPPLWNTTRLSWDHYGAGARSPLGRNVAQAIASFAPFDASTGESRVPLENIKRIDDALTLLKPPAWPSDLLGPVDHDRADVGAALYRTQCASCHGDPDASGPIDSVVFPTTDLGTDSKYVVNGRAARINASTIGLGASTPMHEFLQAISTRVIESRFAAMGTTPEDRLPYTHGRENLWRAPNGYKANPLNGVWSTAPYLHNNSVPSLYDLLRPAADRPARFRIGPESEIDPVRVGIAPSSVGFLLDTTLSGNDNHGHEYGADLGESDRWALVEYLKTL